MRFLRRSATAAVLLSALLAGCASTYRLDSTVQAFSGLAAMPAQPTYRLERLPSQAQSPEQSRLEALADPALFRAGLKRDDAAPRFAVQVSSRTQQAINSAFAGGWGWPGFGWGGPPIPTAANTSYQREVNVVVRELAGNKVVYESKAVSDTFYLNSDEVLAAMFDAALAGFPNPPQGARRVVVQVQPVQLPAAR
jgi:outer membrane murein-binding lipoprotein Lpp